MKEVGDMEDQRAEEAYFRTRPETLASTQRVVMQACASALNDGVKHPSHYTQGDIEPIDYIQANNMNFCLGNVIKYVTRAGKKDGESRLKDLQKAMQYIQFEIEAETKIKEKGKHEIH